MNASQIETFAQATNNEFCDPAYENGKWLVEAVETRESLEDFVSASKNWSESSVPNAGEIGGFKFISWEQVQVRKGEPRRALSVVDFGNVRVALKADLSDF